MFRSPSSKVTSYCTSEGYRIEDIQKYLQGRTTTKVYDECLYIWFDPATKRDVFGGEVYSDSVVNGAAFMRATPATDKLPRSPTISAGPYPAFPDLEIDPSTVTSPAVETPTLPEPLIESISTDKNGKNNPPPTAVVTNSDSGAADGPSVTFSENSSSSSLPDVQQQQAQPPPPSWMTRSEVFIFDYGVVVLWNFSQREEERFLKVIKPFMVRPAAQDEREVEEFNFQYDLAGPDQRIFNDMITLKTGNPLIKLTISHALSQSVKLAMFENIMEETIESTIPLPKVLARHGDLVDMPRTEVMKIVGRLFKLRLNVNLVSNVLDTPELFWSEPDLEGLYNAIRSYMEISPRAALLNKRAEVVSDLLDMLSDLMNSNQMTYITWIVIMLICVAVVVGMLEVWVKIIKWRATGGSAAAGMMRGVW
ncbi:hypothetical protein HK102_012695 [Quaeritorhiza haematococci]|nr:hypothetical protein HK102_012695 [Quaeritorhiza haematococci]